MSFYGSVYYQLIDAFNKVIASNINAQGSSFPAKVPTTDEEIQAYGRTSALSLTNGNKWINFTYDEKTNSLILWHGKPDEKDTTELVGYKYYGQTAPKDLVPINLNAGDYFTTFNSKLDAAGHLVPDETTIQCFKMPRSETEEDIVRLKELVGNPKTETTPSTGLFASQDVQDTMLTDQEKRVIALEDVYGTDVYASAQAFFPRTMWSLDEYTATNGKYQYKDFPSAFGSIDDIRATYFNSDTAKETVSTVLTAVIPKKFEDVAQEMSTLREFANYQENAIDKNADDIAALQGADVDINTRIDGVETDYKAADIALNTRINGVITNYEKADTDLGGRIDTVITNYSAADEALGKRIDNLSSASGESLSATATQITAKYEAADATLKSELLKEIGDLSTDIQTIGGEHIAMNAEIDASKKKIQTLDTDMYEETGYIAQKVQALTATDTALTSTTESLQTQINDIHVGLTSLSAADETINTTLGTLRTDIDGCKNTHEELNNSITNINTSISGYNVSLPALQTSVGAPANEEAGTAASGLYALIADLQAQVNALSTQVNELNAKVTTLEGYHVTEEPLPEPGDENN